MLLIIESDVIDVEFRNLLKVDYDVLVVEETENSTIVVFKGSAQNLIKLYTDFWDPSFDGTSEDLLEILVNEDE